MRTCFLGKLDADTSYRRSFRNYLVTHLIADLVFLQALFLAPFI